MQPQQWSSLLALDYTFYINNHIDSIPYEVEADFQIAISALQSIADPNNHFSESWSQQIKYRIREIKSVLKDIDDLVAMLGYPMVNATLVKQIVLAQVTAKIEALQTLTTEQKQQIIMDQQKKKERLHEEWKNDWRRSAPADGRSIQEWLEDEEEDERSLH